MLNRYYEADGHFVFHDIDSARARFQNEECEKLNGILTMNIIPLPA